MSTRVRTLVEIEDVTSGVWGRIVQTTVRNVVGGSVPDQVLTDTDGCLPTVPASRPLARAREAGTPCERRTAKAPAEASV